jgi:predicted RNase H-like HicB family nuclease
MNQQHYVVVVEGAPGANYSAYVPDLPGCIATGGTVEECEANIRDAIVFHLEGMREAGETVPEPSAVAATVVEVPAA